MTPEVYIDFINKMVSFLPSSQKLYFKLHPRSRMDNYSSIKENKNVVFTNDLPLCDFYIGHYTGLLATVKHISNNILIWLFSDHHTPEYFKKFGTIITNDLQELNNFMNGKIKSKKPPSDLIEISNNSFENFDPSERFSVSTPGVETSRSLNST